MKQQDIWVISREYAGIAEAGGVKNVACSLCEGLAAQGADVTLFIPRYACTDFSTISEYKPNCIPPQKIYAGDISYTVSFDSAIDLHSNVKVVFVGHQIFSDKTGVYTYTAIDEKENPEKKRGTGFRDELLLDVLFQKAVVTYSTAKNHAPQIIHCQDAATAIVPALFHFAQEQNNIKFVVTIHNAGPGYHHNFYSIPQAEYFTHLPRNFLEKCMNGEWVEPFLMAAEFADMTTVSPWYAQELLDSSNNENTAGLSNLFIQKGIKITGITNGIDCEKYDPRNVKVSHLPYAFDPFNLKLKGKYQNRTYFINNFAIKEKEINTHDITKFGYLNPTEKNIIYFGYHGRIVRQKGIDVLLDAAEKLLSERNDVHFIIAGQGESVFETALSELAERHAGKCVYFRGYDRAIARLTTAVSDFIVLPSKFEPCGLEDFIAQLFGTIPVAHATGGLNKIIDSQTGFLYQHNSSEELFILLDKLCAEFNENPDAFKKIISSAANTVVQKYSWSSVIQNEYLPLYKKINFF